MTNPLLKALFKGKCLVDFEMWFRTIRATPAFRVWMIDKLSDKEITLLLVEFALTHDFIVRNDNLTDIRRDLIFFRIKYNKEHDVM